MGQISIFGDDEQNNSEKFESKFSFVPCDVYVDGACSGNPGIGGWGVYIECEGKNETLFGSDGNTTNNRMELLAAINGIMKASDLSQNLNIYTDSQYVQKGMTEWINGWIKSGRLYESSKNPVKNADLWLELLDLSKKSNVNWIWVKGHSGVKGNVMADSLAQKGVQSIKNKII